MGPAPSILVIGSLNIDRIWLVDELPRPGETITASGVRREFGGKGANQAVAASRLGAPVALVGAVGDDADGRDYLAHLRVAGVRIDRIRPVPQTTTGAASIYVDAKGENSIVIESGANRQVTADDATSAIRALRPAVVLMQFEVPLEVVEAALALCSELGIKTLLNPSPVNHDFIWGRHPVHTVVVNENEARHCFALGPDEIWQLAASARAQLLESRKVQNLVVTRGGKSTFHFTRDAKLAVKPLPVTPIDTVGAGDTFAGALAVQLASDVAWSDALRFANAAGALATRKRGAQSAMPDSTELARALSAATPTR